MRTITCHLSMTYYKMQLLVITRHMHWGLVLDEIPGTSLVPGDKDFHLIFVKYTPGAMFVHQFVVQQLWLYLLPGQRNHSWKRTCSSITHRYNRAHSLHVLCMHTKHCCLLQQHVEKVASVFDQSS